MIIEVEDRLCKVAKAFSTVLVPFQANDFRACGSQVLAVQALVQCERR